MADFQDLPLHVRLPILYALSDSPEDVFPETVERDGQHLVIGISYAGDDAIVEHVRLTFDEEQETYRLAT